MNPEAVHAWLLRIDRPAHLDEVIATFALPRWRALLWLRSRADLFRETLGQTWVGVRR